VNTFVEGAALIISLIFAAGLILISILTVIGVSYGLITAFI
jgi:hypothetical protein